MQPHETKRNEETCKYGENMQEYCDNNVRTQKTEQPIIESRQSSQRMLSQPGNEVNDMEIISLDCGRLQWWSR